MLAYSTDLWMPAIIGGLSAANERNQWLQDLAKRFGGATPDVYVDFVTNQAYQAGQPSVLKPADALNCACNATRYRDDVAGIWTAFAPNTLAYSNKGLRVWEARTNSIRNNSMQGAVAGTPGTMPTNWLYADLGGLSHSVVGMGTANGIDYIDIRIFGTSNATVSSSRFLLFESDTAIASANGQTWSGSVFITVSAGSMANITFFRLLIAENNSSGTPLGVGGLVFTPVVGALSANRYSFSYTNVNAATAFEQFELATSFNSGAVIDVTLRIGWPQLEQASFASPPIRTTNAAVSVPAEVVTMKTPPTFGSAASYYVAFIQSLQNNIYYIDNRFDANNVDFLFLNNLAFVISANVYSGGVNQGRMDAGSHSTGALAKAAFAAAASDRALVVNAQAPVTSATGARPVGTVPTVSIGSAVGGSQPDTDITEFAIWASTRIPNASLITGTT